MIWHKTNPAPKIFKAGFLNSCEMIFTCWNKKHTWNFISQKEMHNFFESAICMRPERLSNPKHPAQKPVALLKKIITIASNENDIIFDPFMGVGSMGVAALELNRRFIGVELDRTYYDAAKQRIDNLLLNMSKTQDDNIASEPITTYQRGSFDLGQLASLETIEDLETLNVTYCHLDNQYSECRSKHSRLEPIIKWAGGKEKELVHITANIPTNIHNYYEPFVGGGSVFMAMDAKHFYVNDLSTELSTLYRCIATQNVIFFDLVDAINKSWKRADRFFENNLCLKTYYLKYRTGQIDKTTFSAHISTFCKNQEQEIISILDSRFCLKSEVLVSELNKNLVRKMTRMKVLEQTKHPLPDKDLSDNIRTAVKSALYMYYRALYNDSAKIGESNPQHCALFYFIRNYCYSGMFRYNDKGEFNVPYGGIAYNAKTLDKKIKYYRSKELLSHFQKSTIDCLDFEEFLNKYKPTEDDFIFLDPPYDSEFSTYAQNEFTKIDQERLANYMINHCKAKWMMIIKHTNFIFNLYNKKGINIRSFDKEYIVSFMDRNDKKATHLLITNY